MREFLGCTALILVTCIVGCGSKGGVKSVDVSGTVTLDGEPLQGADVYFSSGTYGGYGTTDSEGKYRLVNGAAVGDNKISFKKFDTSNAKGIDTSIPGMDEGQVAAMMEARAKSQGGKGAKGSLIPPEMSDPKTTKLTYQVPEGGTDSADFRLTSKK
ncbi:MULTISPECIES: hypothetical protein [unclassified Schlesneria]|uniref:hypothetical protein n=1 Tax=Schlesneria TaxID=656899 RepID=UPI002EE60777